MKSVRKDRKSIEPIQNIIYPPIHTWTGNKAFNRDKRKRFDRLSHMLRDDEFLHFCAAIGYIEVNWAMMESQLDRWCQIIFITLKWRGKNGKELKIPRQYSGKVRYLREGFRKIPALKKYCADGTAILNRADELAETRHDLTHGVITHMESRGGKYMMENRKLESDGRHTVKNVVFDVRAFPTLANKLVILGKDAIYFSHQLQIEFLKS